MHAIFLALGRLREDQEFKSHLLHNPASEHKKGGSTAYSQVRKGGERCVLCKDTS